MERHPPRDDHARLLNLLGLGMRGGLVVVGVEGAVALIRRQDCRAVVVAADLSKRARWKVVPLAKSAGVPVVEGPTSVELGERLGRPPVMAVAVRDRKLADGILSAATRGPDGGVIGQE